MIHSKKTKKTSILDNKSKTRKKFARKKHRLGLIIALTLTAILFGSVFAFGYYLNRPPEPVVPDTQTAEEKEKEQEEDKIPVKPPKKLKEDFYTFVISGTDEGGYHTDTIMVLALDTAAKKANIVSVPRDTQVDVPRNPKKINTAYAVGGANGLKKELESVLGFSPQHHMIVDLKAFSRLVNAVGGVDFYVPQDMDMDDPTQDLHIHLKKGQQLLDGDKALQLVRFRGYLSADLGRMETQQKFLKALAKKLLNGSNLAKVNEFVDIFKQNVKTNLSLRDLQWFGRQLIELDPETDITLQTLPFVADGNYQGQNYLFLSPEDTVAFVNQTLNPYTTDITIEDVNIIRLEDTPLKEGDDN